MPCGLLVEATSALVRPAHHLHRVFDVAPLLGLLSVTLAFAGLGLLRRLCDGAGAVLLQHLARDGVNLGFGHHHVALPRVRMAGASHRAAMARGPARHALTADFPTTAHGRSPFRPRPTTSGFRLASVPV